MVQKRPMQDSNLQSSAPEADALSIRPIGHLIRRLFAPYVPPRYGGEDSRVSVSILIFLRSLHRCCSITSGWLMLSMSMQCFIPACVPCVQQGSVAIGSHHRLCTAVHVQSYSRAKPWVCQAMMRLGIAERCIWNSAARHERIETTLMHI